MSQLALPTARALPAPRAHRMRRDRRDGLLAVVGLSLASIAFGAVVSGDPVPASDVSSPSGPVSGSVSGPAR